MTNEKQLENQEKVKMPWHGRVLMWLFSMSAIIVSLSFVFEFLKLGDNLITIFLDESLNEFLEGFIVIISVLFPFFISLGAPLIFIFESIYSNYDVENLLIYILISVIFLFNFYLILRLLKGIKWSLYIFIISYVILFVEILFLMTFDKEIYPHIFLLFILSVILYLLFSCLKHPYYNQKKKLENNLVKI